MALWRNADAGDYQSSIRKDMGVQIPLRITISGNNLSIYNSNLPTDNGSSGAVEKSSFDFQQNTPPSISLQACQNQYSF